MLIPQQIGSVILELPKILILTDGKIGDLIQCRGIAGLLTDEKNICEKSVRPHGFWSLPLPYIPVQPSDRPGQKNSPFNPPSPDLILASGRRVLPYLYTFKKKRRKGDQYPLIVYLKNPRIGRSVTDFIWAPIHDGLSGNDVISTHTSPHTINQNILSKAKVSAQKRFPSEPSPIAGLILGGNSGTVKWNQAMADDLVQKLENIPAETTIIATPSRRTPDVLLSSIGKLIAKRGGWLWDRMGENPYPQILAHSDYLIVTGDSHNMVSECLAPGVPVFVYRPIGLQKKLNNFLDAMEKLGAVRPIAMGIENFAPVRIDATEEIAAAIRQRL